MDGWVDGLIDGWVDGRMGKCWNKLNLIQLNYILFV